MAREWRVPVYPPLTPWADRPVGGIREVAFHVRQWAKGERRFFALEPRFDEDVTPALFRQAARGYSSAPGNPRISAAFSWLAWHKRRKEAVSP